MIKTIEEKKRKYILKGFFIFVLLFPFLSSAQVVKECNPFDANSCYNPEDPCMAYKCEANPRAWLGQPNYVCVADGVASTEDAQLPADLCYSDPDEATCHVPTCTETGEVLCVGQIRDFDRDGLANQACGGTDCDDTNDTVGVICEEEVPEAFCGDGIVNGLEKCDDDGEFCNASCDYNWAIGEPCSEEVVEMFSCRRAGDGYICPNENSPVDFSSISCQDRTGQPDFEPEEPETGFEEVPGCGDGWLDPIEECEFGDPFCGDDCRFIRGTGVPCDEVLLAEYGCETFGEEYICLTPVDFNSIECEEDGHNAGGDDEREVAINAGEFVPEQDVVVAEDVEDFVEENDIPISSNEGEGGIDNEPRCIASEQKLQWVPITIDDAREVMKRNNITLNKDGEKIALRYNSETGQIEQYTACLAVGKEMQLNFTGSSCQLSGINYFSISQALVYFFGLLITFGLISSLRRPYRKNN